MSTSHSCHNVIDVCAVQRVSKTKSVSLRKSLSIDGDAHVPGSAPNNLHGSLNIVAVKIGHLDGGNVLNA